MNRDLLRIQHSFFPPKNIKHSDIEKWLKDVNQFNIKSIYDLTWKDFYKELQGLGTKEFLSQYGYSHKRKLQLALARSGLSQQKLCLYDFEVNTEQALFNRLGNSFFDKITLYPNFNPKNHKLSTIHHYLYLSSLHFTALSLGFSSKQIFLNFFAQTLYVPECIGDKAKNLRMSIQSLCAMDPVALRKELGGLYDSYLPKNKNFIKYNYTLEELKLSLENEDIGLVVASLGGGSVYAVNNKLKTLRPWLNLSLHALKLHSWEFLKGNTPTRIIWKVKLYQLFSGQLPALEQQGIDLFRSCVSFHWQFFTVCSTQNVNEEGVSSPHNPRTIFKSRY